MAYDGGLAAIAAETGKHGDAGQAGCALPALLERFLLMQR